VPGLVAGLQQYTRSRRLTRANAIFGRLYSVVDRIANHVHQGIRQFLNDVAIEFRFLPASSSSTVLPVLRERSRTSRVIF
jgi:hypothetical protein